MPPIARSAKPERNALINERDIHLEGLLSAEKAFQADGNADKCPVHRTLTSEIQIKSRMV
jgi:uncharacterized OsmC-like protein